MSATPVRVLVLYGSDDPSIQRARTRVERLAAEMRLTPIFVQCADGAAVEALAAAADYRILPLDDAGLRLAACLSPRMERPILTGDPDLVGDKWGQRSAFARHGMPSPPFALVETLSDVLDCGRRWGYPLMLKPTHGARSRGVRRVDGAGDVARSLAAARAAARATGHERVLAEGYLDGPDVAVESLVLDGVTHHVSFSQSGWNGDFWQAAAPVGPALQPHLAAIGDAVSRANEALGLRWAATSNELRLTAAGPVIVEVNARLGGVPCEDAILLHAGIDRVQALLAMLAGDSPDPATRFHHPVAQTTIRAGAPGLVRAVEVPAHLAGDPMVELGIHATPGMRIEDPGAFFVGWLLLRGEPGEHAGHLLPRASALARQIRVVTTERQAM